MILLIDTANPEKTKLVLFNTKGDGIDTKIWASFANQSEELLGEVDKLLSKNEFNKKDLTEILVNPGPGSYTGIRVGVTTANLLALSLNIPVTEFHDTGKDSFQDLITTGSFLSPVLPDYQNEPKITTPKARQ